MSRRQNPPRKARRTLNYDYLSWAEIESAVTANSTTDENDTVREASRSEPDTERSFKFIVALDFGTTNTSVSYVKFDPERGPDSVQSTNIKSIRAWPDAASDKNGTSDYNANVPSESWYLDGEYIWGYSVRERMGKQLAQDFKPSQDVIKFSKLLINDKLNRDKKSMISLRKQLKRLKKSVHDIVTDYLTQIFTHTKKELIEEENFSDTCAVELVLCLPAGWDFAAQRNMQRIMEDVAEAVDFGWRDFEPFIINEPEAVAAYLLESMDPYDALKGNHITPPKKGQTFIVCDAGGGTVVCTLPTQRRCPSLIKMAQNQDATTYCVTQVNPYRFREVTKAAGRDCGSSRINEKMFREAAERLKDNSFLQMSNISKEYLIQHNIQGTFETKIKRNFTYAQYQGTEKTRVHIPIAGLRRDDAKDIGENSFYITSEKMALYFKESIEGTIELLREQRKEAERKEIVSKIILAGGFSSSNALQRRVQEEFKGVQVLTPKKLDVSTVVSHGAVFRALNKENGPERSIQASFGLLQDERYNKNYEGHVQHRITEGTMDPAEGWAVDVIEWLIKLNKRVGMQVSYRSTLCQYIAIGEDWIVRQRIYTSQAPVVKDHYHFDHPLNADAEIAGVVEANLNEYRDNGSIQPKLAKNDKEYFSIEYEIVLEVDGRNIKAKLFYPPGQECRDELKMCISAWFRAGTK